MKNNKWLYVIVFVLFTVLVVFGTYYLNKNKSKINNVSNTDSTNDFRPNDLLNLETSEEVVLTKIFKGEDAHVREIQEAFEKIQKGAFKTKGMALNISSYFLPSPNPEERITTMSSANYEGYFVGSDYSFLLNTDNGEDKSSMKIARKDNIKYMTILSSSILDKELKDLNTPEANQLYYNIINQPFILPEELLGQGGFVMGSLLEGWGLSKNLMNTPDLLEKNKWFFELETPIFSVKKIDQSLINNASINRYTLSLIKDNLVSFAIEFQKNSWGRIPTSVEEGLIKDDFGRIKYADLVLDIDSKTGDPLSVSINLNSLDLQDKIYRNLEYNFKANQTFEPIDNKYSIEKPVTDIVIPPILFGSIVN